MRKSRTGFTLVELLIVMGIIILLVTMAVPSVRVLTGTRSLSVAQNQLAAVLTRAREDAIALQDIRGVLFYLDPVSGRVGAVIVQQAVITDTTNIKFNTVLLDTLPGNDSLLLPPGVCVHTLFNGMNGVNGVNGSNTYTFGAATGIRAMQLAMAAQAKMSALQQDDRYLGFNSVGTSQFLKGQFCVGGCILFDGSGRLVVRPYGFQLSALDSTSGLAGPSNLCKFMTLNMDQNGVNKYLPPPAVFPPAVLANMTFTNTFSFSIVTMPGCPINAASVSGGFYFPTVPVMSQIGLVMFDYDAFKSLGFSDADRDVNNGFNKSTTAYTQAWASTSLGSGPGSGGGDDIHSEADKENWIDANCTPIMINRYNGTLIRGE